MTAASGDLLARDGNSLTGNMDPKSSELMVRGQNDTVATGLAPGDNIANLATGLAPGESSEANLFDGLASGLCSASKAASRVSELMVLGQKNAGFIEVC